MTKRPGPRYDNALRLLTAGEVVTVCAWLGIDADQGSLLLSEALPATTQHADLITRTGPGRLAHVEFVRKLEPNLPYRMLEYGARIMKRDPGSELTQHIVILAGGTVPTPLINRPQLQLETAVTYLRDQDPTDLLTSPALAPLAVLSRIPTGQTRQALLRSAMEVIVEVRGFHHRHDLAEAAATMASIYLDDATILDITGEANMPISLDEDTVAGRSIAQRAEARGEARGRSRILAGLLRRTYGDDPRIDAIADQLLRLHGDHALDTALTAQTLDELAARTAETTEASPQQTSTDTRP